MKPRLKRIFGSFVVAVAMYMAAYYLSVDTDYDLAMFGYVPTPHYRPWNGMVIQAFFAPANLVDAEYVRPAHWDVQETRTKKR